MEIKPKLNLNKHPSAVDNNSLIDASNIMVSKDNAVLQTEHTLITSDLSALLDALYRSHNLNVKYVIPCNEELVLFVYSEDSHYGRHELDVVRYSEKLNKVFICNTIEYNSGIIVGTFTYNNNNLIIAFSEYFEDNSQKIPVRTINLGHIESGKIVYDNDDELQKDITKHPLCPEVIIPNIYSYYNKGNCYKGWYYIFVRYKISNNTYTQWFNTNESIYIDSFNESYFLRYHVSKDAFQTASENDAHDIAYNDVSDSNDIAGISFGLLIHDLDKNYKQYQLGFVCCSKSYTKCYCSYDLNLTYNTSGAVTVSVFNFNIHHLDEYSVSDLINTYNNYYNVKTLINNNNKLYLANYLESKLDSEIVNELSEIVVNLSFNKSTSINNHKATDIANQTILSFGIDPYQPYNFFIHFVDKYGHCTNGFNIGLFSKSFKEVTEYTNNLGNTIVYLDEKSEIYPTQPTQINFSTYSGYYYATFQIDALPTGYVGWFVSYEKLEKRVKHIGYGSGTRFSQTADGSTIVYDDYLHFYNDSLNYDDSIDFDFDSCTLYEARYFSNPSDKSVDGITYDDLNMPLTIAKDEDGNVIKTDCSITDKILQVADSEDNLLQSTNIKIISPDLKSTTTDGATTRNTWLEKNTVIVLYKSSYTEYYNTKTKYLIPCSPISYKTYTDIIINPQVCCISKGHAIVQRIKSYFNDSIKGYQLDGGETYPVMNPYFNVYWYTFVDIPVESLQYNNKPVVTFFPKEGLNTTSDREKSFYVGNIVELKNTIDLYQQKQDAVYNLHPKTLDWYNADITNTDTFTKTVRRSNVIQDESKENAWRKFGLEDYKIITENKGDVIKLVFVGYYFLVHTEHSLFLFNSTDTIKSNENNIQLASIDIWDTTYKEVVTSELGFAGIQHEWQGVYGQFGYIFYDEDAKRIFRYDDGKLGYIDTDIRNYVEKLNYDTLYLVNDKKRNRILFNFYNNDESNFVLSYNYNTSSFISRHIYNYSRAYSTKENIYFINNNNGVSTVEPIKQFSTTDYANASIDVMCNTEYYSMKYIEYIIYNLHKVNASTTYNDFSPVEEELTYYAGDTLRVYSRYCDTGVLDIAFDEDGSTVNDVDVYYVPHWALGNWHFNGMRNNLSTYVQSHLHTIPIEITADNCSRIYGNYFVVGFTFNSDSKPVEIEAIDYKLVNGEQQ